VRAMLLAAGFGTRLRPLTEHVPKCLVPIGGRPLLGIWLERLSAAGCGPFLINTHYKAGQVEAFVAAHALRNDITLSNEPVLLGTAATLIASLDFFQGEDGMLIHADNYCLADLAAFVHAHRTRPADCLMTMMTFRTDTPSSCGIVTLDERGVVVGFEEKPAYPKDNLANGAIYMLSAALLNRLRDEAASAVDFSLDILPTLMGRIFTYEASGTLLDIGTPASYARANALAALAPSPGASPAIVSG
jgi:mannose-1-phosphate guanylyltransferase